MQLTFKGHRIHGRLLRGRQHGPPEISPVRTKYAGVKGVSEIRMEPAGRMLVFPYLIFGNFGTRWEWMDYVDVELNKKLLEQNGTIHIDDLTGSAGPEPDQKDCTFHGAAIQPGDPLPPGTLVGLDPADNGWHGRVILEFYQLTTT